MNAATTVCVTVRQQNERSIASGLGYMHSVFCRDVLSIGCDLSGTSRREDRETGPIDVSVVPEMLVGALYRGRTGGDQYDDMIWRFDETHFRIVAGRAGFPADLVRSLLPTDVTGYRSDGSWSVEDEVLIERVVMTDLRLTAQIARIATLLVAAMCCGCPTTPSSNEGQRQARPSRWLRIECTDAEADSQGGLEHRDAEAIKATVPTLERLVLERLGLGTAVHKEANARVRISGTETDYVQLLGDVTKAKVISGRFLIEADGETAAAVVVIFDHLAERLFRTGSPVGQTITIGNLDLTVVGVLSSDRSGVTCDAIIPIRVFDPDRLQLDEPSSTELDRIWMKVNSFDQVPTAKKVIRNLLRQRHPDVGFEVQ